MKLLKRLQNLWALSQVRPIVPGERAEVGDVVTPVIMKKQEKAVFISRKPKDPLEEILKHE